MEPQALLVVMHSVTDLKWALLVCIAALQAPVGPLSGLLSPGPADVQLHPEGDQFLLKERGRGGSQSPSGREGQSCAPGYAQEVGSWQAGGLQS